MCAINLHLFHSRKLALIICFLPKILAIPCMRLYPLKYGIKYGVDAGRIILCLLCFPAVAANKCEESFQKEKSSRILH